MADSEVSKNPFSIKIINQRDKIYRQYIFLKDSDEIINKIYYHIFYFLAFSEFSSNSNLISLLSSLCHKVNMVKYHLQRYEKLELNLCKKYEADIKGKIKEGVFLIENSELTAEYESFLFQVKATLDVLVGFLNPIYRKNSNNPLKRQDTFGKKGQKVIRHLENYLLNHPDKTQYLQTLLEYLKTECIESTHYEDGSINWLWAFINSRDTVAHYGKHERFAFQITNTQDNKSFSPARMSPEQTMLDALKIAYESLLVFIQDFIALSLGPYLNDNLVYLTFAPGEVKDIAPKWYIMLRSFQQFGLKSLKANPQVILQFCDMQQVPINAIKCMEMHIYYNGFYK